MVLGLSGCVYVMRNCYLLCFADVSESLSNLLDELPRFHICEPEPFLQYDKLLIGNLCVGTAELYTS